MCDKNPIQVPDGKTAKVFVIDTGARIGRLPADFLVKPRVPGFDYFPDMPSWVFLVENSSGRRALFDLGIPKDWADLPPVVSDTLKTRGWVITADKDIDEVLTANGVSLDTIESVVWSHWHWDHIGNMSSFPSSTELIVGPGFKDAFSPGYPSKQDSSIHERDLSGRTVRELNFHGDQAIEIGGFPAIDLFGDGSFYILDTPGHAVGHISGLARTDADNPDSFLLFGGDSCHHSGELRPSPCLPLPAEVQIEGKDKSTLCLTSGPFETLQKVRGRSATDTIFDPSMGLSIEEAIKTLQKTQPFDAKSNFFFLSAHDDALCGVIDLFPKEANRWKRKGWREAVQWTFLRDFPLNS
ncbi:beta-lactamase-like protein [Xylogone sp. PMI_703]|nr:beta-lactamase-like protein [Xylogone sp. PMI_703]